MSAIKKYNILLLILNLKTNISDVYKIFQEKFNKLMTIETFRMTFFTV